MMKKSFMLALLLCFSTQTSTFAQTIQSDNGTVKIALMQEVMQDVLKSTLYGIGNSLSNKVINKINNMGTTNNTGTVNNPVQYNGTQYNTNPSGVQYNTGQPNIVPENDLPPEDMIPVSQN